MSAFLLLLILSEVLLPNLTCAARVRRQTTKVRISAVGDTITLKFLQPHADIKLEGYILGYGSRLLSKQLIQLPEDGEPYETEIDAEPKYLIAVQPVNGEVKKQCTGKEALEKPLHLVIGSVSPTSVMLSWGTLLNTLSTETNVDDCVVDGQYTVRYREKEPKKNWKYQTCPTTDTVIDQLTPDTPYEFGVQVVSDNINGAWSPAVIHSTAVTDIYEPQKPENLLNPEKPITEIPQAFSPSVPNEDEPLKDGTLVNPMMPVTESPQVFSPSLPTLNNETQSSPSSPIRHTAPPPLPTETQALHTVTQSRPASILRQPPPSPTQRVTQDIDDPQKPESILNPEKPVTEIPQAFSPSVPILYSVTQSSPPSLLRHTPSPPTQRGTLGTGSDDIRTSHHAEDSLFLTQTLTSSHTLLRHLRTTNIVQTHQLTTTQQPFHINQSQLTTSKTQFHTHKTQTNTTKTVISRDKAQLNRTQKKGTQLQNTINLQSMSSTSTYQLRTTQVLQNTVKHPLKIAHPKPRPPHPSTVYPQTSINRPLPSTPKGQLKMTQNKFPIPEPITTKPHAIQTKSQPNITHPKHIATQSPPYTDQPQSITTQYLPNVTQPQSIAKQSQPHTTQHKLSANQSQPQTTQLPTSSVKHYPGSAQSHPTTTQSQPRIITPKFQPQTTSQNNIVTHDPGTTDTHPTTTQSEPKTTQSQTHTIQPQPIKTQFTPTKRTTKSQTKPMKTKVIISQTKPRNKQQKPSTAQSLPEQPQPTTSQSNTAKYQTTFRPHQQSDTKQHHKYKIQPKFTNESNAYYHFSTTLQGLRTTEFQQKSYHQPTSATIKHSDTNTLHGKTERTSKSKTDKPVQMPSEKSSTQNPPWGEKKPVNKKLPVSKMGQDMSSPAVSVAHTSAPTVTKRVSPVSVPIPKRLPPTYSNTSVKHPQAPHGEKHKGQLWDKPNKKPRKKPEKNKKQPNQVVKKGDKVVVMKLADPLPIVKPSVAPTASEIDQKPTPTTTPFFALNGSRFNLGDNSSVFSSVPFLDVDPMGNKRFVAPHVVYQIDKPPKEPCSVTHSLSFFPDEENEVINITGPPKTPPTNVTVFTVEGCPSFVILNWKKTDNETTEYEVTSCAHSCPNGSIVSVVTTNQTHVAVENLKPQSSYEFTVTPKNELGSGPTTEPVSFSTESADPRVSEIPTGKNAIWSSFSFKADSYSECTGTQYVKRTWYRKFVGIQLCNSLRYKIYLSDSLKGKFYNIGDETGNGEDHCQFVDSFLDGRTGGPLAAHQLPLKQGYFRAMRQEPVRFGKIGGNTQINYVPWYECGVPIPGSW